MPIDDRRQALLDWLDAADNRLDQINTFIDTLDNLIDDPNVNWQMLSDTTPKLADVAAELDRLTYRASQAAMFPFVSNEDSDLRDALASFLDRATALSARLEEDQHHVIRLMGEVGRAHDRRPMEAKESGAHVLYR